MKDVDHGVQLKPVVAAAAAAAVVLPAAAVGGAATAGAATSVPPPHVAAAAAEAAAPLPPDAIAAAAAAVPPFDVPVALLSLLIQTKTQCPCQSVSQHVVATACSHSLQIPSNVLQLCADRKLRFATYSTGVRNSDEQSGW